MEKVDCYFQGKMLEVYKNLSFGFNGRPICGAVINIILTNLFQAKTVDVDEKAITKGYFVQDGKVLSADIKIPSPLVCSNKLRFLLKNSYNEISNTSYFINSFYNNDLLFPNDGLLKQNTHFMNLFSFYSTQDELDNINLNDANLSVVCKFHSQLLKRNSTYEGTLILINALMLLFNCDEDLCSIKPENFGQMKAYICEQFQKLDGDKNYKLDFVNIKYKTDKIEIQYNALEYRVLKEFCIAFNNLEPQDKYIIRDIFNEKTKNIKII